MISIYFVDLGELADAYDNDIGCCPALDPAVEIIEESVLVTKTGKRIDMTLRSVIADGADKVIGSTVNISDDDAAACADIISAVIPADAVLHVMS